MEAVETSARRVLVLIDRSARFLPVVTLARDRLSQLFFTPRDCPGADTSFQTEGLLINVRVDGLTTAEESMSPNPESPGENTRRRVIDRLRELVAALDRRVPQIAREGEPRIARDSAALRKKAQDRIAQLRTGQR